MNENLRDFMCVNAPTFLTHKSLQATIKYCKGTGRGGRHRETKGEFYPSTLQLQDV
jgi:hypothetical protein